MFQQIVEGWGSLSRGHHSFHQTFPYWEGGNTMRSRKTHSMHFSNKNPGHTPCHRLAPPQPTVLRRRQRPRHLKIETKPLHFCMASMLVLLDLRALFILITIYPWCFPSFLRSGKTPTKNCLELGYSNKAWFIWWDVGWVAARILGHLCFPIGNFFQDQTVNVCTIIVWQRNHQL